MKKILIILIVILGCSKSDGEVAEENQTISSPEPVQVEVTPDFENDSIYKEIKPKILMSYWNAFVKSASLYDVDLSYIDDITFSSQDKLISLTLMILPFHLRTLVDQQQVLQTAPVKMRFLFLLMRLFLEI